MAHTLTDLIPDFYAALDIVSREQVGLIPAVTLDSGAERAAVDQTVRIPIAPAAAATDITPAVTPPDDGDQTIANNTITLTKSRRVPFRWNGEQTLGVNNGVGWNNIRVNQVAQAIRTLTNEMEADIASLHATCSRAYGTAGTTPFASNIGESAQIRKILEDNGAPTGDLRLVVDTAAGANLRTLSQLTSVNSAGTDDTLRRGIIADINGFGIGQSGQIVTSTAGTASSSTTDDTGYAVGSTTITLAAVGTGTYVAGDIITFAGDTNKYVVASGDTDVSDGGTITLAEPGLKKAIPASATAVTVVAAAARNMAFSKSAIVLATRAPALPDSGDSAKDRMLITDPISGITFELAMYAQYRQMQYEISATWGYANIKPEHSALLLG